MKDRVNGSGNPFLKTSQLNKYLEGKAYRSYEFMGAVPMEYCGEKGFSFTVWAPGAKKVSVVGDFNGWNQDSHPMHPQENTGMWHAFIKGAEHGQCYKYCITTALGEEMLKIDPYARFTELPPKTASRLYDTSDFLWTDKKWMDKRKKTEPYSKPMLIYEMHLGSWRTREDGTYLNYREMADELTEYLLEMNYTHVELMPVSEHPFDGSWGYQVTGYFAPTSRYGEPKDFMYFVNKCHEKGISVIMDWVPAHFPKDSYALARYDGTPLYEYPDPRKGEYKEWGTYAFDFGKGGVVSFLLSSAFYWLDVFHIDGIRVDAVSSMLYLDFGRDDFVCNIYGGRENLEAIEFLRKLNTKVFEKHPNVIMAAEESSSWDGITRPVNHGGLGFNYKWNMGWMNDSLRYMALDPCFRKNNHSLLTFSMMYAFKENYILPLSHDEVVHGKCSLIQKMSGLYGQKFDSLRTFYMYIMAHPGKKLLFMGGEIAQFIEWRYYEEIEWKLLEFEKHKSFRDFVKELNRFYKENKPFWEIEDSWAGFDWINADDSDRSVFSFIRRGKKKNDEIVVVCNFTPVKYEKYIIGVPRSGTYSVVFSSSGDWKTVSVNAKKKAFLSMPYSIELDIEPMSGIYLRRTRNKILKGDIK